MNFKDFLAGNGYKNIVEMNGSSLVFKGELGDKEYIVKTDSANDLQGKYLLSLEKEILQKSTNRVNGLSRLEKVWNLDSQNLLDFALVKKYVAGESLENSVDINNSTEEDAIKIVKDLHSLGYCSFDIKPRNFVIEEKTKKPVFIDIPDQYTQKREDMTEKDWELETSDDIKEIKYMMRNLR